MLPRQFDATLHEHSPMFVVLIVFGVVGRMVELDPSVELELMLDPLEDLRLMLEARADR